MSATSELGPLFDRPASRYEMEGADFERRFQAFHAANPSVYRELVRLARQAVAAGRQRLGIRMLWEVCRWHLTVQVADPSTDFRLNDHYTSRYARLIAEQEPDLREVFELRALRSV